MDEAELRVYREDGQELRVRHDARGGLHLGIWKADAEGEWRPTQREFELRANEVKQVRKFLEPSTEDDDPDERGLANGRGQREEAKQDPAAGDASPVEKAPLLDATSPLAPRAAGAIKKPIGLDEPERLEALLQPGTEEMAEDDPDERAVAKGPGEWEAAERDLAAGEATRVGDAPLTDGMSPPTRKAAGAIKRPGQPAPRGQDS